MISFTAALFVFLACCAAIAAFGVHARGRAADSNRRLRALRAEHDIDPVGEDLLDLARVSSRSRAPVSRWLARGAWAETTGLRLRQAGLPLRPGEYLLVRLLFALAGFIAPLIALQGGNAGVLLGIVGAIAGFAAPALYVGSARSRRIARIEVQLIEFLPALAASLRSGFAFQPAMETAAQQIGPPLNEELAGAMRDIALGGTTTLALRDLGGRVGSVDLDMVITAILVQRTTGGNLPEILDHTADALRDRERVRGDVRTFTAQQRLTGLILSAYPIAVGLVLLALMPSIWSKLFTEPAGQVQLAVALSLQLIGFFGIRRALRIEV